MLKTKKIQKAISKNKHHYFRGKGHYQAKNFLDNITSNNVGKKQIRKTGQNHDKTDFSSNLWKPNNVSFREPENTYGLHFYMSPAWNHGISKSTLRFLTQIGLYLFINCSKILEIQVPQSGSPWQEQYLQFKKFCSSQLHFKFLVVGTRCISTNISHSISLPCKDKMHHDCSLN